MKKVSLGFVLLLAFGFLFCNISYSQDLASLTDNFYSNLADIIEANMNSPKECLDKVIAYYQDNQAVIKQIQAFMSEAMKKASPLMQKSMEQYSQMSETELEEMKGSNSGVNYQRGGSTSGQRYTDILTEFSQKHPTEGMKIATKAMELVPISAMGSFNK